MSEPYWVPLGASEPAPPPEHRHAISTAGVTLTTTATAVPGTTINMTIGLWVVIGVFDFGSSVAGSGVLVGSLGGNAAIIGSPGQALLGEQAIRGTVVQTWVVQVTVDGQGVYLACQKTGAGGTSICNMSHTGITAIKVS